MQTTFLPSGVAVVQSLFVSNGSQRVQALTDEGTQHLLSAESKRTRPLRDFLVDMITPFPRLLLFSPSQENAHDDCIGPASV